MPHSPSRAGRGSSEATDATTLSEGMERALRFSSASGSEDDPTVSLLRRNLSVHSVISTTSSNASRMQRAATISERQMLRTIGLGSCGTVFEIPGTERAYKKGTIEADIWRDFCLTNRAHNAITEVWKLMEEHFPDLINMPRTPRCHEFHRVDEVAFWEAALPLFPSDHRTVQPLFEVDRIFPLPQPTREALINQYFDQDAEMQQEARDDPDNKHCLVRIYLGERETLEQQQDAVYESLRNFPLRLNMMEDLDLDISDFAKSIAVALATLHWQAQIDGMDVEYVLGSAATWDDNVGPAFDDLDAGPQAVQGRINFKRRATNIYMFDFDKTRPIELTPHDVDVSLVPAFMGNDPYYPMPNVDEDLWEEFCCTYLKASELILQKREKVEALDLPKRLLKEVERRVKENEAYDEDNIVFGE